MVKYGQLWQIPFLDYMFSLAWKFKGINIMPRLFFSKAGRKKLFYLLNNKQNTTEAMAWTSFDKRDKKLRMIFPNCPSFCWDREFSSQACFNHNRQWYD